MSAEGLSLQWIATHPIAYPALEGLHITGMAFLLGSLPAQTAPVDGPGLLKAARLPTRRDRRWEIELAPLSPMQAWGARAQGRRCPGGAGLHLCRREGRRHLAG